MSLYQEWDHHLVFYLCCYFPCACSCARVCMCSLLPSSSFVRQGLLTMAWGVPHQSLISLASISTFNFLWVLRMGNQAIGCFTLWVIAHLPRLLATLTLLHGQLFPFVAGHEARAGAR